MSRETKFRAKEITKGKPGKWVYGDYFSQHKDGVTKHYIVEHPYGRDNGREIMWEVDGETRGEFIGRQDDNEQDVYEGDIIKTFPDDILGIAYAPFEVKFGSYGDYGKYIGWYVPTECEVIGNRTDTPELVEAA